jgi:hypothetical protein
MKNQTKYQSQINQFKLSAEEYINIYLYVYEIKIPNIATVFLAVNRQSVDNPEPFIQPEQSKSDDSKNLKPVLNLNSSYGGTRAEPPVETDPKQSRLNALNSLIKLAFYESHTKHKYLSKANEKGALDELISFDGKTTTNLEAHKSTFQKDISLLKIF